MNKYVKCLNSFPNFLSENIVVDFQDKNDAQLEYIKNVFCLEKHLSNKSSLDNVCSLMTFVHHELFSLGDNIRPLKMNTFSIMEIKQKGSVFCSCYATVLSEMLLSVGILAVRISCFPMEFDCDCHVGVMVYLEDLNKWAFFDPTFNTYFYDNDKPIDIFEIRELYKNDKPVTFKHIEINKQWQLFMNGEEYSTYDDWYNAYMQKNCFRFLVPQKSQYGYLSNDPKYYFMNPVGYHTKNEYDELTDKIEYINGSNFLV